MVNIIIKVISGSILTILASLISIQKIQGGRSVSTIVNFQINDLKKVTTFFDGTIMDDSKVDGVIYKKIGIEYFAKADFVDSTIINVAWFGALGDGLDYSNEVQKAIDFAPDSSIVLFPRGNYKLANIVSNKSITILGNGEANIYGIKQYEGYDPIKRIFTSIEPGVTVIIDGLNIFGGVTTNPTYHPLQPMDYIFLFENAKSATVKNCYISGITLRPGTANMEIRFRERRYSIFTYINCTDNVYSNNEHRNIGYIEQVWIVPAERGTFHIEGNKVLNSLIDPSGKSKWSLTAFTVIHGSGIFRNNEIRNITQSGANLFVYNSIIEDNIIENVLSSVGLDFSEGTIYAADNNIIRRNQISNTKEANLLIIGSNNEIYDNKLDYGKYGIWGRASWNKKFSKFGNFTNWEERTYENINIYNNHITNTSSEAIFLYCTNDENKPNFISSLNHINIENNIFNDIGINNKMNTGEPIHLFNIANVNIRGNNFNEWGKGHSSLNPCIYIGGRSENVLITSNKFNKKDKYALVLFGKANHKHSDLTIENNILDKDGIIRIYDHKGQVKATNNLNISRKNIQIY